VISSPFYRITQLIIEPKESKIAATSYGGQLLNTTAFNAQVLNETLSLYMKINSLHALCKDCEDNQNKKIKLRDICFQPLEPDNLNCATQSVFQYWQNDETRIRESLSDGSFLYHLDSCMRNPYLPDCLAAFGGPLQPYMIAGSYENNDYLAAKSLIMTFVINNHIKAKKPEEIKRAMAWEYEVLQLLKEYSSPLINVIYTTERSIEDELERESKADMKIIGISYIVMFFYLTITLGKYSSMNIRVILIEMKFFLAMSGVVLVILSVLSSGGFFMYLGVPATLITLEVIPFLLLAVGIDNIYGN
jgi:Niemann-Pick C1 protein